MNKDGWGWGRLRRITNDELFKMRKTWRNSFKSSSSSCRTQCVATRSSAFPSSLPHVNARPLIHYPGEYVSKMSVLLSAVSILETCSCSRYWTGTSLQVRLLWGVFKCKSPFSDNPPHEPPLQASSSPLPCRKQSGKYSLHSPRRRANARNVTFRISLRRPIHIIKPNYLAILPTDAAPQFH